MHITYKVNSNEKMIIYIFLSLIRGGNALYFRMLGARATFYCYKIGVFSPHVLSISVVATYTQVLFLARKGVAMRVFESASPAVTTTAASPSSRTTPSCAPGRRPSRATVRRESGGLRRRLLSLLDGTDVTFRVGGETFAARAQLRGRRCSGPPSPPPPSSSTLLHPKTKTHPRRRRTWTPMCSRLSCTSCTRARCRRGRRRRCPPAPPRKTTTGRRRRRPIDSTSTGWRR